MRQTQLETVLAGLENGLKVADIATAPLHVCHPAELVSTVRAWAGPATINNVPVREGTRLIGVLENVNGDAPDAPLPPADQVVRVAMRKLAQDMLVEGRQPLRTFIGELPRSPYYRLVLHDGSIDAIVTPSDGNKLPVRLVAYTMVVHLEAAMLELARHRSAGDDEAAVRTLNDGGVAQVMGLHRKIKDRKLNVSPLDVTSLMQKAKILKAQGVFDDESRALVEFEAIYEEVRNPLMHGTEYINDSLESLTAFTRNLERVATWTDTFASMLRKRPG